MAHLVVQVVQRCENAEENQHLGKVSFIISFFYIYLNLIMMTKFEWMFIYTFALFLPFVDKIQ